MDAKHPDGTTPIDPSEAGGLRLTHVSTREELNYWESLNIRAAKTWADKTRPKEILDETFIKTLHRRMFGDVWKWAGKFRLSDKNIGISWHQIPVETRNLLDDVRLWLEIETYPPDEIVVRFHHRLVSIHPFPNGNGRHARFMADLLMENVLAGEPLTWGTENIGTASGNRQKYIEALRAADNYNYAPLLYFVRS